jgi:hypothetical protein
MVCKNRQPQVHRHLLCLLEDVSAYYMWTKIQIKNQSNLMKALKGNEYQMRHNSPPFIFLQAINITTYY